MKCKSKLYYYVLMPLLCFVLVLPKFTILSYASTTSGTETTHYNYTTIYPNNQLNQNVINKFNNMSLEEKEKLLPFLSPIFLKSLGIYTTDAYTRINDLYNQSLASFQNQYPTAQELQDSDESYAIKKAYTYLSRGHGYYYYDNFLDYLSNNIQETDGQLVLSDTETIYNIYDDVIHNEQVENGIIYADILSYKDLNTDVFYNLALYNEFIRLCEQHKDSRYVFISRATQSNQTGIWIFFPTSKVNLYNNGTTLGNSLRLCNDNGVYSFSWHVYRAESRTANQYTTQGGNWKINTAYVGARTPTGSPNGGLGSDNSGYVTTPVSCYTLNPAVEHTALFTSLNGWINHQGHYEPSYEIGSNYGTVPSAVVSSNDMTTYYNITYTDNSQGSHNTVWYPPNYDPTQNGYYEETHTLKFDGVSSFLSSLGNLIGSLINGIAEGIANIINSLITVVNNLKVNLLQGPIFELLTAFMGWLPVEIVTLLTALFSITVIFALIKLLKGFF